MTGNSSSELAVDDTIDAELIAPALTLNEMMTAVKSGDLSDPGIDHATATNDELADYADVRSEVALQYASGSNTLGYGSVLAAIQAGGAMNAVIDRAESEKGDVGTHEALEWLGNRVAMSARSASDYRRLAQNADALHEARPTSIKRALKILREINPRKSPTKAASQRGSAKPSSLPDAVIAKDRGLSGQAGPPAAVTAVSTDDRVAKLEQQLADQKAAHIHEKVELVRATRDETASLYMPEGERDRLRAEASAGYDESAAELFRTFAVSGVPDMVDQLGDVTETLIGLRRDGHADAAVMAKLDPALAELMDEVNVTRGTAPEPNLTPISARRPTGEELSRRDTRLANEKATKRIAELESADAGASVVRGAVADVEVVDPVADGSAEGPAIEEVRQFLRQALAEEGVKVYSEHEGEKFRITFRDNTELEPKNELPPATLAKAGFRFDDTCAPTAREACAMQEAIVDRWGTAGTFTRAAKAGAALRGVDSYGGAESILGPESLPKEITKDMEVGAAAWRIDDSLAKLHAAKAAK